MSDRKLTSARIVDAELILFEYKKALLSLTSFNNERSEGKTSMGREQDVRGPVPRESLKRSSSSRSFFGLFGFAALTAGFATLLTLLGFAEGKLEDGSKTVSGTGRLGGLLGAASSTGSSSRLRFADFVLSLSFFFFFLSGRTEDEEEGVGGAAALPLPLEAKMSSISEGGMGGGRKMQGEARA